MILRTEFFQRIDKKYSHSTVKIKKKKLFVQIFLKVRIKIRVIRNDLRFIKTGHQFPLFQTWWEET